MQVGDRVIIISGNNEGKTGAILSGYPIEGLEGGEFSSLWFVEFEDGDSDIIQESMLEYLGPE